MGVRRFVLKGICIAVVLAVAASGAPHGRAGGGAAGGRDRGEVRTRRAVVEPVRLDRRVADVSTRSKKPPSDAGFVDTLATVPSGTPIVPSVDVDGLAFTQSFPPDTVGEVGTTHFVQMTNDPHGSRVGIFTKSGAPVANFRLSTLAPGNHPCSKGIGDPVPLFDQFSERWLLTEIRLPRRRSAGLCVYVSSGADPVTSTFTLVEVPTEFFTDYPKWSVWPDAIYIGANELGRRQRPAVYAIDRAALLAGGPVSVVRRKLPKLRGFPFNPIAPVDLEGTATPPDGSPGVFVRHRDDEVHDKPGIGGGDSLELFEFHPDFANPDASTLAGPTPVGVAEFSSDLCGLRSFSCVPQPGTKVQLDPLREPVMHRPLLRTFADHQALVGAFVTDIDGLDTVGVRWFELRRDAAASTGGWTLFQQGTVGGGGLSRWMPSVAIDADGDIAIGYSASSKTVFPSIHVAGRSAADAPGVLTRGETVLTQGLDAQSRTIRWGDYSAMSVDPVDGNTFWYTDELGAPGGKWRTRIAAFSLD
jgi:hypothetical protein